MKKLIIILLIILVVGVLLFQAFYGKIRTGGEANLSWNPNTETDLSGYKIYYGTVPRNGDCPPGGYTDNIDVHEATSYNIGNLKNGQTYYFSVTSYNNSGKESCFSEEMKKDISSALSGK
ncbi:MAG: fibronectin type III domain-containing protein [Parcubacteria group bacterium]